MAKRLDILGTLNFTQHKDTNMFDLFRLPPLNRIDEFAIRCEKIDWKWDLTLGLLYLIPFCIAVYASLTRPSIRSSLIFIEVVYGTSVSYFLVRSLVRYRRLNRILRGGAK